MGFRFSLATVLRVRDIAEEREQRMLQRIAQEMAQTRAAWKAVDAAIEERDASPGWCGHGLDFHAAYAELAGLRSRREELTEQLVKLEELRRLQVQEYAAARRKREMLTEMCAAARGVYDAQAARREQSAADESFLSRRAPV